MKKKRLLINLISNIIAFIVQLGISFILTPIIVEKVGDAAYGFIGLANNFVNYATIFTILINSMASRFVTLELTKGNKEKANRYYASVLILDIIMSIFIAIVSSVIILHLEKIINIPKELNRDVKITFILAFINLILSINNTVFSIATFAKNRLDIDAIRNIICNIIKAIFLIIIFSICTPQIYYITIGTTIFTIIVLISNIIITKKIAPELSYDVKLFDKKCIKELTQSGIWNAINSFGKTLLTGLDLLIANIFIGAEAMGLLSIAKTIPISIENLLGTMANVFTPDFIILYSKNKIKELVESVDFSTKIIALIMIVPIAGFIVFGIEFFSLWLPSKTATEIIQLQVLSILSLAPYIISISNYTLFSLDIVTNNLKRPVIVTLVMSILSTITTLIVLKYTELGVYAVAGISSIFWAIKVLIFNTINAAINLKIKWYTFFRQFIKNLLCFGMILMMFYILKQFLILETWKNFIISVFSSGVLGYIIVFMVLLNKQEKTKILEKITKGLRKNT